MDVGTEDGTSPLKNTLPAESATAAPITAAIFLALTLAMTLCVFLAYDTHPAESI